MQALASILSELAYVGGTSGDSLNKPEQEILQRVGVHSSRLPLFHLPPPP